MLMLSVQVSYDLVLMDGFMPVKDGWQASREICMREKQRNRSPLIIGAHMAGFGLRLFSAHCP
jgi:CheY-like chemotaxis protein